MKFSIIVPVYNTEKYVGACIESVLNQVYQDFELILVDDGSTDRSGDICEEYAAQDSRIKVFHKSNSGQLDARCYGIMQSSGQFIVFLDSDDLLSSSALDVLNQKVCHHRCDMVIYAYARFFDTLPNITKPSHGDRIIVDKKDLYLTLLTNEYFNSLCIKAVKREFLTLDASDAAKSVR